jgi:nicotinate-nucleotide pyrophosphorylase (carboxylating)
MASVLNLDKHEVKNMFLPHKILEEKLLRILAEDVGQGDVTTALIVPSEATAEALVIVKDSGVAAGIEEARVLLESLGLSIEVLVEDGEKLKAGQKIIQVIGDLKTILSVERTLLNILSRMSGIATTTRRLIEKLRKARLKVTVACTRKTAPGLAYFDKKAVLIGGGDTHRVHLDDMILIKDNHIAVTGDIKEAMRRVKERVSFTKRIEVEATNLEEALEAANAGADIIMLDNFSPKQAKKACFLLRKTDSSKTILIEASGGINAENIVEYASAGVDIISLGEITQSPKALNMNLEITKIKQ